MQFIKEFIKRKENEIIDQSNKAVKILNKDWNDFLKCDTYLIYEDKFNFLHIVKNGNKETKVPWYLFWDFKLKSNLKENFKKLQVYKDEIESYNKNFVIQKKKEYKDLFKKGNLTLDDNQQTAIITDDKHNLVVAGAGSGKTEVLITKIAYLIKRKLDNVKPERILALAFQNKAANEIKERLKERYGIDVEIRTFHSLGKKIIEDAFKKKYNKAPTLKPECSEDWEYQIYIQRLFEKEISTNNKLQNDVIGFMKKYEDKEIIKQEADFKKKEEFYEYQRGLTYAALNGEKVKSEAEREILNFFLMNKLNGKKIKIIYKPPADWMKYKNENGEEITHKHDFYFPDFDIYLEHWAIGKNGKVPEWFKGKNPTKEYINSMNLKKEKYKSNQKILFETSQADYENGDFTKKLSQRFLEALKTKEPDKKFDLEPLSYKELVEAVWDSAQVVKQIPKDIAKFIVIAKTYRLYPKDIEKRLEKEKWSPMQYSFAKIANQIYEIYQMDLEKSNYIDFSDMINVAVDLLKENKEFYRNKYDYILIDEYQDISTQRYEMIKELMSKNSKCKLFCVGDDWQSIMGFAGSNLDFFINFDKYFLYPARTDLTKNYRSIKSIVDAGACIIKGNKEGQIKKKTISNRDESKSILVFSSKHQKKFFTQYYEQVAKHCLNTIKEYHITKNYPYDDFMILLRITTQKRLKPLQDYANFLGIPVDFENRGKPNCVKVMSVHKSKGLQARAVMVLNVDKGLYGFPCELENPDIFEPAIGAKNDLSIRKQEERRLFYVAVTRAKEEVMIYTRKCCESEFIRGIEKFVKREELKY